MEIATIIFFTLVILLGILMFSMKIISNHPLIYAFLFILIRLGGLYVLIGGIWQLGKILGIFI